MKKGKVEIYIGPISVSTKGVGYFDIPRGDGKKPDRDASIEIQPENLNRAFPGDTVEVELTGDPSSRAKLATGQGQVKNRDQGKVLKIVERARDEFVGLVEKQDEKTYVIPDDKRIYVDIFLENNSLANAGEKVLVKITNWENLQGEILKVIGKAGENNTEME